MNNSHKTVGSAIWLAIIGTAIFNLGPLFLAAASEKYQLSNQQIGFLASSELVGIALTSISTPLWLHRQNLRKLVYLGLLLIVFGNLLSILTTTLNELIFVRFGIGLFGSGVVFVIAIVILGNRNNATKNFGLLVFSQMIFIGITFSLWPLISLHLSLMHILLFLSILGATGLLIVRYILLGLTPINRKRFHYKTLNFRDLLALAGIFLFAVNLGSIWGYSERIGISSGLATQEISKMLSASMIPQAFGAAIPAILGNRLGYLIPLIFALLGLILGLLILIEAENASQFLLGISLWGSFLNLGIAYKLGLISTLPHKNHVLAMVPGIQSIAIAFSPSFCALFILNNNLEPVINIAIISAFFSSILFMMLSLRSKLQ